LGLSTSATRRGVVVRAGAEHRVKQGADYQPGVSAETAGSFRACEVFTQPGSKADFANLQIDIRSTPESGSRRDGNA